MADIEKAVVETKLKVDSKELKKSFDEIETSLKNIEALKKKAAKQNLFSEGDIKRSQLIGKEIKEAFNNYNGNLLNKSMSQALSNISGQTKALNRQLKAIQAFYTGLPAMINKAELTGKRTKLMYSGADAEIFQQAKTAAALENMQKTIKSYQLSQLGISNETQKYAERSQQLNQYLGVTQLRLMANYAAINAVTNGLRSVLNYTGQFNEELKQLQAISAVSDTGLKGLKETIYEVANATKFNSLEVAKSATVLAQAGLSVSQIKETLPAIAKLATATGTDLATSTDVITSTLNIYSLQVTEATQVTNALTTAMNESKADIAGFQTAIQYAGNFAAQLGMSYEETAAAIAAATQAGIRSKSMLGTGLRAVLTEFLKPTDKLVTQLGKVGLTLSDIDVRTKGFTNVLKTLKDAGFGAAEAFRGMERRGAAFLVALINQVDFIGQLRERMAGSTAAMKANETQMEALTNQWKNFKSILGNIAYEGLEPIIELLSKLLKTINSFMSSGLVGIIGSVLFGTITVAGTTSFVSLIIKSLGTISSSIVKLGKSLEVMQRYSRMHGVSTAVTGISAIFTKLPLGQVTMFAAAISALITTLGMAASAMGLFTSESDKAKAKLEESLGELDKAQQGYSTLQNMLDRFYANRQKLDNQAERNIFVREIITRIPEASTVIKDATISVDELEKALHKLNDIRLDKLVNETKKVAEATKQSLFADTAENLSNIISNGWFGSSSEGLHNLLGYITNLKNLMPELETKNISTELSKAWDRRLGFGSTDTSSKRLTSVLIEEIRKAAEKRYPEESSNQASYLRNTAELIKDNEEFKQLLNDIADNIEAEANLISAATARGVKAEFSDEISQIMKDTQSSIADAAKVQEDVNNSLRLGIDLSKEQVEAVKNSSSSLEEMQKRLDSLKNVKTTADLASFFGIKESDLKIRLSNMRKENPELRNVSDKDLVTRIVGQMTTEFSGAISRLIEAMTSLEDTIAANSQLDRASRNAASETSRIISQRINSLGGIPAAELAKEEKAIKDLIDEYRSYARAAAGLGNLEEGVALTPEQKKAESRINMQIDVWEKKLTSTSSNLIAKIDTTSMRMDYFFKMLKANIEEADAAYNKAIANMNKQVNIQQGIVTGAERYYGSGSVISSVEQQRLTDLQEANLAKETEVSERLYKRYEEILETLRNNPMYSNIKGDYFSALERYQRAQSSGSAVEIEAAYRNLNRVSDTYNKFAKQETDLEKSMYDLKETIDVNNATLDYIKKQGEMSGMGQITSGFNYGIQSYRDEVKNQGLLTLGETTASYTKQSVDALDSSLSEMFSNILSGSAKAGDAFKSFGQTVIATLRDIAVQMAVKQGLNLLFSAFGFGTRGGKSPTNLLAQIPGFGKAQGGLVVGPTPNRDSVLTKLMPGEYVLKKSAVDTIGKDYLDNLNNNSNGIIQGSKEEMDSSLAATSSDSNSPTPNGIVNIYVVAQDQQQGMSPNDVLVTISNDILKGGQTKRLIKQVAVGGI
jgi:TP901 family phage tail tape measure protein